MGPLAVSVWCSAAEENPSVLISEIPKSTKWNNSVLAFAFPWLAMVQFTEIWIPSVVSTAPKMLLTELWKYPHCHFFIDWLKFSLYRHPSNCLDRGGWWGRLRGKYARAVCICACACAYQSFHLHHANLHRHKWFCCFLKAMFSGRH